MTLELQNGVQQTNSSNGNPNEFHPLVRFCEVALVALREARETLAGCPLEDGFPPELREGYADLYPRTKRPEVTALVLGPLKAGKSTLLNVLARTPHISQISQLPAYPCFIEVRNLERDKNGHPVEEPRSIFYRRGNTPAEELSHGEGIKLLDSLLDDFIRDGRRAVIEYERVVQKVDLPSGVSGVELTLVDSPGLFFDRRVDDTFFGDSADEEGLPTTGYSDVSNILYDVADVVIFVLRPEQLFFHNVSGYLRHFARRSKMRVFILVNASTHSKTQEGDQIIDFDQVERQDEVREYFLQHIADASLVEEIRKETRVSLHFADLLDAATAHFTPDGDLGAFASSRSGESLDRIRDYLFGSDLARYKIEDLSQSIRDLLDRSRDHFRDLRLACLTELSGFERQSQALAPSVDASRAELDAVVSRRDEAEGRVQATRTRLEITRLFVEEGKLPEESDDPVLNEFVRLNDTIPLPESSFEEAARTARDRAHSLVTNVYEKWRDGDYGPRSLKSLAEAIWESKVEDDALSLRSYSEKAVLACFREVVGHEERTLSSPEMLDALSRVDPGRFEVRSANPMLSEKSVPLLDFPARWTFRLGFWRNGFRITPGSLWGLDGQRVIRDGEEEKVLYSERKAILNQIWNGPWRLGRCFSSDHLQSVARRIMMAKIGRSWGVRISEELAQSEKDHHKLAAEAEAAQQDHNNRLEKADSLEEIIQEGLDTVEDLETRISILSGRIRALETVSVQVFPAEEGPVDPVSYNWPAPEDSEGHEQAKPDAES